MTFNNQLTPYQTGTVRSRSQSQASSYSDYNEDDDAPGISRARLHPDEARSHFSPAQVDARDVDFSDRVTGKRKSYKASTRRHRKAEDGTEELGDFSDEEDGESLERKMARLRREIEEVREEKLRRDNERRHAGEPVEEDIDVDGLSKMMDGIASVQETTTSTAGSRLAKNLGMSLGAQDTEKNSETVATDGSTAATYTITYAPSYEQSHTLAKAADFDSRLVLLEKALGINASALPALDANGSPQAILPTLDILQRQLGLLTSTSSSSLDNVGRRIRTLTQEAERLEEARRQAKSVQDALRAAGGDASQGKDSEESEQMAKINALYGTLPTIENLAPLLPPLLDRLRSLRAIHADAATASESLERAEKRQEDMAADIKKWREGLEKVEESMKQSEATMMGNMKVVEGWVKELEEKMEKFTV